MEEEDSALEDGELSEKGSRITEPRVKPRATLRVTEIILPVKRRTPCSDLRRDVMGLILLERSIAIARPIDHASIDVS